MWERKRHIHVWAWVRTTKVKGNAGAHISESSPVPSAFQAVQSPPASGKGGCLHDNVNLYVRPNTHVDQVQPAPGVLGTVVPSEDSGLAPPAG